jgi:hypothetical protein
MEKHPTIQQPEKANAEDLEGNSDVNRLQGRAIQHIFLPTGKRLGFGKFGCAGSDTFCIPLTAL